MRGALNRVQFLKGNMLKMFLHGGALNLKFLEYVMRTYCFTPLSPKHCKEHYDRKSRLAERVFNVIQTILVEKRK